MNQTAFLIIAVALNLNGLEKCEVDTKLKEAPDAAVLPSAPSQSAPL